jgi:hypothetical protein
LHNDIIFWLERKGVGWSRAEEKTKEKDFLNNITTAFFPLTSAMFDAMRDKHNAGKLTLVSLCYSYYYEFLFEILTYFFKRYLHVVKPFPDTELYQITYRKLQGSKGRKIQERLECSIKGFHDALTDTSEKWKSVEGWPLVLKLLENLHKLVDR